jgi:D-inositol-3-phosphate glycosyltransferase
MRIGMLSSNYVPHPGGLEVMVQNLVRGLARRHEVVLVTSGWNGTQGTSIEDGFTVHRIGAVHFTEEFGIPYPVPFGPGVKSAWNALQVVDVIHVHGSLYAQSALGALLSRWLKKPLIVTEHVGFVEYRRRIVNGMQRIAWSSIGNRVVRAADVVTTYNTRVQGWLASRFPDARIRYVGNGVDVGSFRPRMPEARRALRRDLGLPAEGILVLYAGRATEKKNLEAVLAIPREHFHLVVCGWKRDLRAPNLTDLGVLPHSRMSDLFGAVDMMVHASVGEGLPLAVQEGISSGLPLVLLWDDGYSGWISPGAVEQCATLDDVSKAVLELATSAERRAALSTNARAWAESHWSWDATVQAYECLYRESVQRRGGDV